MKKVFRIWKLISELMQEKVGDLNIIETLKPYSWVYDCEGKTREECSKLRFLTHNNWLVEEKTYIKVFSIEAFTEWCFDEDERDMLFNAMLTGWIFECEGKTKEECKRYINDEWLDEIEEGTTLSYRRGEQ